MFLIARAPGWSRVRLMGCIALSAGGYCAVNLVSTLLTADAPLLRWIFEINLVMAALHGCMWLWFTFAGPENTWGSVPAWARWQGLGTLAATLALAVTGSATDPASAFSVRPGLRGITNEAYLLTTAGNFAAALVLLMLVTCGVEYWRRARSSGPGAVGILVGFLLFAACIVEEALVAAGVVDFYFLSDVGYVFIVVPLAGQLLARFSDDAWRLTLLSDELASEVEERTSERDAARESLWSSSAWPHWGGWRPVWGTRSTTPCSTCSRTSRSCDGTRCARTCVRPSRTALDNALEGAERIRRVVDGLRRYGAVAERTRVRGPARGRAQRRCASRNRRSARSRRSS